MKVLIVGDIHFSQYSSIVRKRGKYYSQRLENCIKSLVWVENLAAREECDRIIYLGDFFDKAELNAEEITALQEVPWVSDIPRYFLVGNHEIEGSDYNSASVFNLIPNAIVIHDPRYHAEDDTIFVYLPYILGNKENEVLEKLHNEISLQYISDYKIVVFSHNDIKGIQMGQFISKSGLDMNLIENSCDLFLNGHLHNGCNITNKIINVGNLTGQNFSEDARRYEHKVMILETDKLTVETYVNPCAYNFYKVEVRSIEEFDSLIFKDHSIVSIKCPESLYEDINNALKRDQRVEDFRIVSIAERGNTEETFDNSNMLSVDHIKQFKDYIQEHLEMNDILLAELQELA